MAYHGTRSVFVLLSIGATLLIASGVQAKTSKSRAAYLTIAYEATDVSHVACLLEFPGKRPRWIGFGPSVKYKVVAGGAIDGFSIEKEIKRYVRFRVDASDLARAEAVTRRTYRHRAYILGVFDCVTFATDLADHAGLNVPSKIHFQVEGLIDELARRNRSRISSLDQIPYPWRRCRVLQKQIAKGTAGNDMVTVRLDEVTCRETESLMGIRDRLYLIAYTESGKRRTIRVGKLGDNEQWRKGAVLFRVPRGTAVGIQLWDADRINHDDLVFQTSFCACKNGHLHETQRRGRAARGSLSIYRVGLEIASADKQ